MKTNEISSDMVNKTKLKTIIHKPDHFSMKEKADYSNIKSPTLDDDLLLLSTASCLIWCSAVCGQVQ